MGAGAAATGMIAGGAGVAAKAAARPFCDGFVVDARLDGAFRVGAFLVDARAVRFFRAAAFAMARSPLWVPDANRATESRQSVIA
jgi:hypothetical protein